MGKRKEETAWTFTAEKENITAALGRVLSAVDRRNTTPVLSHVKMDVLLRGAVCFTATDLEVVAVAECSASVPKGGGVVCVPAEMLKGALAGLSSEVAFTLQPGLRLVIESDGRRFELACLPGEEFPSPPLYWEAPSCHFEPEVLPRLIKAVSHAICQNEQKYNLCGVFLCQDSGRLTAVAADGFRLALAAVEVHDLELGKGFMLPAKAARLLSGIESGISLALGTPGKNDNQVLFDAGGFELSVRLIEGQFPDYRRYVPDNADLAFTIDTGALGEAIEAVTVVSDKEAKSAIIEAPEELLGEALTVSALGPCGVARATVPSIGGTGYKAAANAKYLRQALKALGGEIFWKQADSHSAILMVPVDHDAYGLGGFDERFEIVMPQRI